MEYSNRKQEKVQPLQHIFSSVNVGPPLVSNLQ